MSKFSALFFKHIWYIFIRSIQKLSHAQLHLYFRIFYLYVVLLGWKNKMFWKKRRQAFLLISVYVQLCFDRYVPNRVLLDTYPIVFCSIRTQLCFARYVPKYFKFVYFLAGSGVVRSEWLDHSLQGWIKILDRLHEFSCDLCVQTRSENHLAFS